MTKKILAKNPSLFNNISSSNLRFPEINKGLRINPTDCQWDSGSQILPQINQFYLYCKPLLLGKGKPEGLRVFMSKAPVFSVVSISTFSAL